jgi:hypothetical protein
MSRLDCPTSLLFPIEMRWTLLGRVCGCPRCRQEYHRYQTRCLFKQLYVAAERHQVSSGRIFAYGPMIATKDSQRQSYDRFTPWIWWYRNINHALHPKLCGNSIRGDKAHGSSATDNVFRPTTPTRWNFGMHKIVIDDDFIHARKAPSAVVTGWGAQWFWWIRLREAIRNRKQIPHRHDLDTLDLLLIQWFRSLAYFIYRSDGTTPLWLSYHLTQFRHDLAKLMQRVQYAFSASGRNPQNKSRELSVIYRMLYSDLKTLWVTLGYDPRWNGLAWKHSAKERLNFWMHVNDAGPHSILPALDWKWWRPASRPMFASFHQTWYNKNGFLSLRDEIASQNSSYGKRHLPYLQQLVDKQAETLLQRSGGSPSSSFVDHDLLWRSET